MNTILVSLALIYTTLHSPWDGVIGNSNDQRLWITLKLK